MADVFEVLFDSLTYADFTHGNTQSPHQFQRVLIRSTGGAEARHSDTGDVGSRPTQFIHGFDSHQQSQGGIKTAGNAHDHVFATSVCETLGQTLHLNGYDLFAVFGQLGAFGYEGGGIETPVYPLSIQCRQGKRQLPENGTVSQLSGRETGVFAPVVVEAFHIDVGHDEL
ncbi:MAG: hypothetical protein BWY72_01510 [Bacteroidetes bacterium ADurb.Bin416]|nr:MAG: hypothetical protein BWY72_01510 [Bacteroidetes bacterium ADurb.Bin416]